MIPPEQGETQFVYDYQAFGCGDESSLCEAGVLDVRWKLFFFPNGDPKKYTEKSAGTGFITPAAK